MVDILSTRTMPKSFTIARKEGSRSSSKAEEKPIHRRPPISTITPLVIKNEDAPKKGIASKSEKSRDVVTHVFTPNLIEKCLAPLKNLFETSIRVVLRVPTL